MTYVFSFSCWTLLGIGFAIHLVGSFWLLFAAYKEDIQLARMIVFAPALSLLFIGRYPRAAIIPCVFQLIGFVFLCSGMNRLWEAFLPR